MIEMTQPRSGENVFRLAEVAKIFGVDPRSIQRWVKDRRFPPPFRPGGPKGTPYWSREDIDLYIAAGGIQAFRREKRERRGRK